MCKIPSIKRRVFVRRKKIVMEYEEIETCDYP